MVSDWTATIFVICLIVIVLFIIKGIRGRSMHHIHKLYLMLSACLGSWMAALLCLKFTDPGNTFMLYVWDACTNIGCAFAPALCLCIALTFTKGWERQPRWARALFVVPAITNLVVWTNPLHHLQYRVFSVIKSEIVFGPYVYISGLYNYICLIASIVLMVSFAVKNKSRLYLKQSLLFSLGGIIPLVVSSLATFGSADLPITATPLSFIFTILLNGIAIYQLHILDIRPVATQHILDWISDCYLVLSEEGLVISYNKPFAAVFASQYGIAENRYLSDCVKEEDVTKKTAIYNLITAVDSCRKSHTTISYEQPMTVPAGSGYRRDYYITDVKPLVIHERTEGYVVIYKDVTQLKKSMQQLQDSQTRMMEQERLAFLGQMVGGLAHNLKTPIMSISGCLAAAQDLVEECLSSLDDPEVGPEDYREIFGEMRGWFDRARESSAYMSDIITAIKGQAANASTTQESSFTVDELLKRASLLMRHELASSGCSLEAEYESDRDFILQGDINNLVQVVDNLLSNAIYAQKQVGGGKIVLGVSQDAEYLKIYVKDTGPGVNPQIKDRLFREMITSKGSMGTGLGLYISNAVVRGKFGGFMWMEDNPGGGSIFGFSIPFDAVADRKTTAQGRDVL